MVRSLQIPTASIQRICGLANFPEGVNPLDDGSLGDSEVIRMDITKMTREALKEISLGTKEKDRAKNMFVLGFPVLDVQS